MLMLYLWLSSLGNLRIKSKHRGLSLFKGMKIKRSLNKRGISLIKKAPSSVNKKALQGSVNLYNKCLVWNPKDGKLLELGMMIGLD